MTPDVAVFAFDYVDPLSYLVHLTLAEEASISRLEEIELVAAELRPPPEPFLSPDDPEFRRRWSVAHDEAPGKVAEIPPPIVPWTRKAHELRTLAAGKGLEREVHAAIFRAFFQEGEDIGRVDVLVRLAMAAGLDYSETKAVLDVDKFTGAVEEEGRRVRDLGVPSPPTLVVRGRRTEGWEGREALLRCLAAPIEG